MPLETEVATLRRGLRDLAAVSLLHGLWDGREVGQIADGLCGTVYRLLDLDLAAVRVGSGADSPTVSYPPGAEDAAELIRAAAASMKAGGELPLGIVVHAQDLDGVEAIVVGRAARRPFPSTVDALIFRAVSNEAAVAARASSRLAEARSAKRLLEAVIQQMPIGIIIAEAPDGRIVARNTAFDRMMRPLALQPGHGATALNGVESLWNVPTRLEVRRADGTLFPPTQWPLARSLLGEVVTDEELALAAQDGSIVTLSVSSAPVRDLDGGVVAAVAALADVTVRREAEAVRDAFISMLSHELRTPTTTIYAGAQLLRRSAIATGAREGIIEDIAVEAERLDRIVQNFLVLARVDRGAEVRGHEPVLIQRLVKRVLMREEQRWPDRTFVDRMDADLPPVAADESALELVVRNLLNNAAKYGGTGAAIEVRGEVDGATVRIEVLDDGPGLTDAEAADAFSLFYRSARLAAAAEGAGVGLYVVRATVRAMEGSTWAAPRDGGGARFGFALPIWADAAEDADEVDSLMETFNPSPAARAAVL